MKKNWKYNLCWLILMVAGFYLINTLMLAGVINTFIENMLVTIGINIILAVGLNLVIGFSGQFSLGHAGFMAMGVNTTKWKLSAFVLGAATAAIAGSLYASYLQTIVPSTFGIMESINILIFVVLGGLGSITGTFVATTLLGVLDAALQSLGVLRMVFYAVALIIIMIFKPGGLFGKWEFSFKRLLTKKQDGDMKEAGKESK